MFGIVGALVAVDIIFLIPSTAVSNSRLRREYEEIEGDNVSSFIVSYQLLIYYVYLIGQ